MEQAMTEYYVYQYLREDGTPYYIGKGKNTRAYENHGKVPIPKKADNIQFVQENMLEEHALELEVSLIKKYGRKDNKTGMLLNRTDGGDGLSNPSLETREKMRYNIQMGVTGMLGKTHSDETKMKMSESAKKRGFTEEQRSKIASSMRGRKEDPEKGKIRGKAISAAKKGRSNGREGFVHSEETKKKIAAQKGWKHSEEAKRKMKEYWQRKREKRNETI
jgi:hypothetical protein